MNIDFKLRNRRNSETGEREERFAFRCFKGNSSTQSNPDNSQRIADSRTAASEGSISTGSGSSGNVSIESSDANVTRATGDAIASVAESGQRTAQAAVDSVARAASDAAYSSAQASAAASQAAANAATDAANAAQRATTDAVNANVDVSRAALSANTDALSQAFGFGTDTVNKSIGGISDANKQIANISQGVLDFRSQDTAAALDLVKSTQEDTNALIRYTNEQFTQKLSDNTGVAPTTAADNMVKYVTIAASIIGIGVAFYSLRKSKA